MNRGIYPILSGALVQEARLQLIAHNTANVNTRGFKRDEAAFEALLARAGQSISRLRPGEAPLGSADRLRPHAVPHVFARVRSFHTDFAPGRLMETKNPLHLALRGEGFFEIQTPEGPRYTRNGVFHLDVERRLVSAGGNPVMGAKGPLTLPVGDITVDQDGGIEVNGRKVGKIKVILFDDLSTLRKAGEASFRGENPQPSTNPSIAAGHVEESNVNAIQEMVKMIEVMRLYEAAQKLLQTFDDLTATGIQEIGRSA